VQHLASALGAGLSSRLLTMEPDGRVGGMTRLSLFAGALALLVPLLLAAVQRRLLGRAPLAAAPLEAGTPAAH
jgi:hypothetical protein